MKRLVTAEELETLGNLMVREYLKKTRKYKALCFDIEAFITDFLNVRIEFETFAEEDSGKTGFMANGHDPLTVVRAGKKEQVIFPENTIVIEKFFLREEMSAKRRFTQAHEAPATSRDRQRPRSTVSSTPGRHMTRTTSRGSSRWRRPRPTGSEQCCSCRSTMWRKR